MVSNRIVSANLHLTVSCNYRCAHCFDRHLTKGCMKPSEWIPVLDYLRSIGVRKINLAGGEPTLYPYLDQLVNLLISYDFTISIVSNGSMIDISFLERYLGRISWIGLSIDSPDEEDEVRMGRHCEGIDHIQHVKWVAKTAKDLGYKVKINITVTRDSWCKDFRPLIWSIRPDRVKVFRVLTLKNANDDRDDTWSISDSQFEAFRSRHADVPGIVFEDNCDMLCSYLMFDPLGRWMVNDHCTKSFLPFEQLLNDGPESIIEIRRYNGRGAIYDW